MPTTSVGMAPNPSIRHGRPTSSVGPEPPRAELGQILAVFYRPYYDLLCGPFGGVGFLIALILGGVPFVLLVWMAFWIGGRKRG